MRINIKVIPNSKVESIQKDLEGNFRVHINEKPIEGRANKAVLELLARHFKVSKSKIIIVSGLKSRKKVIDLIF